MPFPYEPPAGAGRAGTTVTINDIAEWKSGYVGVGTIDRGASCAEAGFFHSIDGLHWDLTFSAPSGDEQTPSMCPRFVVRVGDQLIALGQERLWRSKDGIAWTELDGASLRSLWGPSGSEELVAVAAGPGGMVLIGQPTNTFDSIVAYSIDGREWTQVTLPARQAAIAWDATATRDGFVVVGRDGKPDRSAVNVRAGVGSAAAWASTDGMSWTEVEASQVVGGGVLSRVLPTAAGLFAIGNDQGATIYEDIEAVGAWTSADGRSWQKVGTLETLVPGTAVLASDGTNLVALRNGAKVSISTDGRGWSSVSTTGVLQVPKYLLSPISVREASPLSSADAGMWVTGHGLLFRSITDSPEGFAVSRMQSGTAAVR